MAEAPLKDQDAVEAIQNLPDEERPDDDAPAVPGEPDDEDDEADDDGEIAAPHWWDAEAKQAFNDIPNSPAARDYAQKIQQYVAEAEAKREAVTQRMKAEAAEAHKVARGHIEAARGALGVLHDATPGEVDHFHQDYHDIDWAQMPRWAQENPAEAGQFFAEYNARRGRVEQLLHAKAVAEHVANDAFSREQAQRLREIAPELAHNEDHLRALGDYARGTGLPAEAMKQASADELVILNKARLWDEAQARAAAAAKNPKAGAPTKTVRPVAAQPSGTHAQRSYAAARDRALKSRNDDDAVAAILAGGF